MMLSAEEPVVDRNTDVSFGLRHFGQAALGDIRRTRRLIQVADAFVARPDASLPHKCGSSANYQGLLGLLGCPHVTHTAVLDPHCQLTHHHLHQRTPSVTLLVGDITELDFTSKTSLQDQLGPIGNGSGFGYECFNLLAIDPQNRVVIGLANQILFCRRRDKMAKSQIAQLPVEDRQSGLWMRATGHVLATPTPAHVVRVFDRESDSNEVVQAPGHYLIRSRTNRCIRHGSDAATSSGKLHTYMRTLASCGEREVVLEPSPGRAGRTAVCAVSYAEIQMELGSDRECCRAWCVRVWEENPPLGQEGIEWLLLTSVAVTRAEQAQERVDWYECRWLVEEYHKALKTGVRIECVQLTDRESLEPLIAILSVLALNLLWLRDAARESGCADKPAEQLVGEVLVELASRSPTGVKVRGAVITVGEFYQMVARLGGYLGNFKKKPPGWITLWRGWSRLNLMALGVRTWALPGNL